MITLQICLIGSLLLGFCIICLSVIYLNMFCSVICCPPLIVPYICIFASIILIILVCTMPFICITLSCAYTFVIVSLVALVGVLAILLGAMAFICCFCNLIAPYILSYFYGFFTLIIIPMYCLPCCLISLPISIILCMFLSTLSITIFCLCCIPLSLISICLVILAVTCTILSLLCCTIMRPNILTPNLCFNYIILLLANLLRGAL